jgi:hypothetical protein
MNTVDIHNIENGPWIHWEVTVRGTVTFIALTLFGHFGWKTYAI